MHSDLYFVKVHPLLAKYLGETGSQLPDLRRHRAILSVNNNVARFHIGYTTVTGQGRRDGPFVKSLKFQQAPSLRR